jgi:two-component system chemotaxis sensor kinase CheA
LFSSDAVALLSDQEALELIFTPGFSTAQIITDISGRGVGMDVVRSNIERIGGIVEVDSRLGEGTRMTLRVPLTLTIIPALTVSIAGQHFAIPRSAIEEIVRANGESVTLEHLGGAGVATIRGRRVPEVSLATILGLDSDVAEEDRTLVVLRPAGGDVYALSVDRIHDHEELVVKPAAPGIMATGLYAGTTLADDGSPILLMDPAGLAEVGGIRLETLERGARIAENAAAPASQDTPVLLFRGLDGGRRALRLAIVDRIEEVHASAVTEAAGQLRAQVGEKILPLAGARQSDIADEKVRLFRLNDGVQEMGYAFAEVIDFAAIEHEIIHADRPGEVSGVSLVNNQPAELIDAHWLFANHVGCAAKTGNPPVCRLPAGDPWMQNMLRPIVEAVGYRVVDEDDKALADLAIVSHDAEVAPEDRNRTIRLRSDAEASGGKDDSIYRYDRAGLLMALKSAAGGNSR